MKRQQIKDVINRDATRNRRILRGKRLYATVASASVWLALAFIQPAAAQPASAGIIAPTNTFAGKTYSEWSAAWWQYFMKMPATNNPFALHPPYAPAPLSAGQSGPVWFLGGDYDTGGTYNYTSAVPGGVGLFVMIGTIETDNTGCPHTNAYTEAELRAMAKSAQDNATNLTCTIDGVAVSGLSNVLTSPYRVQSPVFDYTCPAVHNILDDTVGKSCYRNSTGIPYTISGAVADGVFLMVAPLSVGSHTIHVTRAFPIYSYYVTYTYHLTVQPVELETDGGPSGNLILSWPQTPDTYAVQTSPSLGMPNWQSANLVVSTNNGILQATAPVGTNNQFFRLQKQ